MAFKCIAEIETDADTGASLGEAPVSLDKKLIFWLGIHNGEMEFRE